jgi:predicted Zn-dependent protease
MAPTGLYLDLVREIRNAEKGRMRDLDEALPALIQGESVSAPPAADALETRWRLVRASRFQDAGRVGATVTEYRAVLARDPGCQAARWRLAEVLASLDRPAQAAAILGEGVFRSLHPARWNAAIRGLSGLLKPE